MSKTNLESELALDVDELLRRYAERMLSPVEVIDAVAARVERVDPQVNAFVTLCLDRAAREAEAAARRFAAGSARPLEGVPIAVKDLLDTEGVRTTYGSAIFADHVASVDAEAVRRVREAGAIVVGKTSTHEFAWGITCENPHYGACRNPWDRERVSGGSSGGSAAALATGVVPLALGSDTGGSIRIPAAFCGVVGLKPTYDRVDAEGTFPLAPSLDHVGPMATRPRDAWRLYSVIARDAGQRRGTPAGGDEPSFGPAGRGLAGVRIAACRDPHGIQPADDVEQVLAAAASTARELGATIVDRELPVGDRLGPTFATVQRAEALETHRRRGLFPQRSSEYGDDVLRRLEASTEIGLGDYVDAAAERERIAARLSILFEDVDLLLTPVSAGPPVRIGETTCVHRGREVDFRSLVMGSTTPQNLAGLPACTLRGGFDSNGLPIGVQLTGSQGRERLVIAAAEELFRATLEIQERRPRGIG